jgi:chromosome segregation ATPase
MMNYNERFGQIETMLADLLRRMDRQAEQIDSIINILKVSDERQTRAEERQTRAEERQTRAEERQDSMLAEMRRGFAKSEHQFNEQNERIKEQGQRIETMLNTQMQMLELMSRQATRTDELEQRVPTILAFENRMRRLEDAVFNKAS